jgi:DNA-binding transcriptional LysR family regulator
MQNAFSWDDVPVFLALWRKRTLSAAAASLRVNASTVGRRLSALEASLGARLFDRTPNGVSPTQAAEQLVDRALAVETAALGLAGAVSGFEVLAEGTVRLTAPPAVAEQFVAPALPRLRRRYPRLALELDASIGYADLTRREADLGLRLFRPTSGDLVAVKVADEPSIMAGSRAMKAREALKALGDVPWITWDASLGHLAEARWVAEQVPPAAVVLRTNSIEAQLTAVERGLGVVLVSRGLARRRGLVEVKLGKLLQAALPPRPLTSLWLVGHQALRNVPRVAAVWTFILEEAKRWASDRERRFRPH